MNGVMLNLKDMKIDLNVEVPDNNIMYAMSEDEYTEYVKDGKIFRFEPYEALVDPITGRALATTQEQFDILIEALTAYRNRMSPKRETGD